MVEYGGLDAVERDQHRFGALVIHFAAEPSVRAGEQLQHALTAGLFVGANEMVKLLPRARFDNAVGNVEAGDDGLQATDRART